MCCTEKLYVEQHCLIQELWELQTLQELWKLLHYGCCSCGHCMSYGHCRRCSSYGQCGSYGRYCLTYGLLSKPYWAALCSFMSHNKSSLPLSDLDWDRDSCLLYDRTTMMGLLFALLTLQIWLLCLPLMQLLPDCQYQRLQSLFRCRIEVLNFSMDFNMFNIIAPKMELLHIRELSFITGRGGVCLWGDQNFLP